MMLASIFKQSLVHDTQLHEHFILQFFKFYLVQIVFFLKVFFSFAPLSIIFSLPQPINLFYYALNTYKVLPFKDAITDLVKHSCYFFIRQQGATMILKRIINHALKLFYFVLQKIDPFLLALYLVQLTIIQDEKLA